VLAVEASQKDNLLVDQGFEVKPPTLL